MKVDALNIIVTIAGLLFVAVALQLSSWEKRSAEAKANLKKSRSAGILK